MKKLLIMVDWYEPGYKAGGPIQSVKHFVDAMYKEFDISILTSDRDINETQAYKEIQANQWIERAPGISVYYADMGLLDVKKVLELVNEREPDFIYLNSMYSYRFSIIPLVLEWRSKIGAKIILAPRGMLHPGAIQSKTTKKKFFIRLLNLLGVARKIHFQATDKQEKKDIQKNFPSAKSITEISNFSGPVTTSAKSIEKKAKAIRAVYISRIVPKKNILFFVKLLNKLPTDIQFHLEIYGDIEDQQYWQESMAVMQMLPKNVTTSYEGSLPHSKVAGTLELNHVLILPTKGENFGHAIFESFSAGRPVIISDQTPWLGLKDKNIGWDLSLDDPDAWIAAITEAANWNQSAFNEWSASCIRFAAEHVKDSDLKNRYLKLFS